MSDKLYTWVLPGLFFLIMPFCSNQQRGVEKLKTSASANKMTALNARLQVLKGKSDMLFLSSDALLMQARNGTPKCHKKIKTINAVDSVNYDTIDNIDHQTILKHEY